MSLWTNIENNEIIKVPVGWKKYKFRDVVEQITTKLKVKPSETYNMTGVKWYGEGIFLRETVVGNEISATYLMPVVPRALIYNRLFAWKESFAVVPENTFNQYVSNEFPQFKVDESLAIPEYLYLYCLTDRVIQKVNKASIGSAAVSRNRLKEESFLDFDLLLPPMNVQHDIVSRWNQAQNQIKSAKQAMDDLIREIDELLWRIYGEHAQRDILSARSFALGFGELGSWDLKSSRASAFAITCPSFQEMGEFVEEATELIRPYDEPEKLWPLYGVNNKEGVFLSAMQEGKEFNASYKRVIEGWFFHNPTRCNVGSLGIVPTVPEDAITSPEYQVWKLKENSGLVAGYTALMIRTSFFLALVQFNRVGAVKERMYVDNLKAIRIPVLPLEQQLDFSRRRDDALRLIGQTATMKAEAKAAVEKMIIGE